MPKRVDDVRLSIERVLLAFSENESGSLRDESLGCLEGDDEGEEFVEVGVRSKCRLGLGWRSVVESSVILSRERPNSRFLILFFQTTRSQCRQSKRLFTIYYGLLSFSALRKVRE